MVPDVVSECMTLFLEGLRDVFYGIYQYYKNFKSDDKKKVEPSDLQVFGWSKLVSLLFWIVLVNGFLLGVGHVILEAILAVLEFMVLKVCGSLFPESSEYVWNILCPSFASWFPFLWIFPLFLFTKFANLLWFQDIAELTGSNTGRRLPSTGISRSLADNIYTVLLELIFLVECSCLMFIPDVGSIASTVHLALLYSMYAFEYKWSNCGIEMPKRIEIIESNLPYFLGFGLPLAIVTSATNSYIGSGCVFAFLFPWYIISGNTVKPSKARQRYCLPVFTPSKILADNFCRLVAWIYKFWFR